MDPKWLDKYPPVDKDALAEPRSDFRNSPKKLPIEARLDLHGYRLEEALAETRRFIDASVREGFKKVLVIHGKGDGNQGILKREVRKLLEGDKRVGAMGHPRATEGGVGALWVILK